MKRIRLYAFILSLVLAFSTISSAELMTGSFQYLDFNAPVPETLEELSLYPWSFGSTFILKDTWFLFPTEQYVFRSEDIGVPNDHYYLMICAGTSIDTSVAEIYQAGTIPISANSVQFSYLWGDVIPSLYLDDVEIALFETTSGILAGDIRGYSGTTATLKIEVESIHPMDSFNETWIGIDNIGFSTEVVPEPSSVLLFGLGGLSAWVLRRHHKSQAG